MENQKLELSKNELNGKTVVEYLNEKYDTVELMRGYSYKLNNQWVDVLTEDDIRMNEIIRKSFYRCFYGGKIEIDTTSIKNKINEYLKDNTDIDTEKYSQNKSLYRDWGYNIIDDEIHNYLHRYRYDIMEMLLG
tara:strand:- start:2631 stop:3032 length:402 start_codon:yes stop_codon:yes gene_type:complete